MITKRRAGLGKVRVGFSLPAEIEAERAAVCGDFTGWKPDKSMKRGKDGRWQTSVALDAGRSYRFRYLLDGTRWENDWAADAYVPNPFGGDDSVVQV